MSWLIERPSPVPSPAGFVVKNGLNIFSFTSGGMPGPLSRFDLHPIAEVYCRGRKRRLVIRVTGLAFAFCRRIKPIRNYVKKDPAYILREQVHFTCGRIERSRKRDFETLLFRPGTVIGEIEAFLDQSIDIHRSMLS